MVERPPPRSINELEMDGPVSPNLDVVPINILLSGVPPSVGSPTSPTTSVYVSDVNGLGSPVEQTTKLPPRPYISRKTLTTTSSVMKVVSPCVGVGENASTDPGSPDHKRENENGKVPRTVVPVERTRSGSTAS